MSSFKSMSFTKTQTDGHPASIVKVSSSAKDSKVSYHLNMVELVSILKNKDVVDKEVALISISGAFRKGKSFMLNIFVAYLEWLTNGKEGKWLEANTPMNKFHYRGGSKPDTNGITMWSKPYLLKGSDGKEYAVFLMDTQGTFDHNSTVKDCASIFAMSTLLSSVQIFNLDKQIQGDDLDNLRLFTEYAQLVEKGGSETPFQKLLFLIRDWENSDEYEFGLEGGKEYLRELLEDRDLPEGNRVIRENLQKSFKILEACLMPYPGEDVASNNSKNILGKIKREFGTALEELIPHLLKGENLVGKKINGHLITCGELAELFKTYMKIFNSGELPEPKSILEATAEAVNLTAEQTAKEKYDELMRSSMSVHENLSDLETLKSFQGLAIDAALKIFEARPKMGQHNAEKHRDALTDHFKSRYEQYKKMVERNIKLEEEKRQAEEERHRLAAEREEELMKRMAMEMALKQQQEEQKSIERKHQEELKRRAEEDRAREINIIGQFCTAYDTYEVVTNLEIHNRSRYLFKHCQTKLHRGVVEIPPTDIGPNEILRCGFHKTNYSWWGCGGYITWNYSPDRSNYYDVTLLFETIWKSVIYQHPNSVEVNISTDNRPIIMTGMGSNPAAVENHLISVTASTGDTNQTMIRVTISDV